MTEFSSPAPDQPVWELSGWWLRFLAQFIDGLLVGIPAGLLGLAIFGSEGWIETSLLTLAVGAAYYPWIMVSTNGQTIGKKAAGIRVVREDGLAVDAKFALLREVAIKQFLFGMVAQILFYLPTLVNYLLPLPDKGNQAIHDKMVKSRVVRAKALEGDALPVVTQPAAPEAWPTAPPAPPSGPPRPPAPPSGSTPYTPPPGFENPVPDDD